MEAVAVYIEKPLCKGMRLDEVISLLGRIKHEEFLNSEMEAVPLQSTVMGFMTCSFAEEIDYDTQKCGLDDFIKETIKKKDDDGEDITGFYEFKDHYIYLTR